jgi:phosphatidate cytidylyltransferase
MKKRIITGIVLLAVLIPAVYLGGMFFLTVGVFLSVVASYEMMTMFYKKSPALKNLRYIVPAFSGLIVLVVYYAATRGLTPKVFNNSIIGSSDLIANLLYHFWVNIVFVSSIIICLGMLVFIKSSTAHDMMAVVMTLVYCGLIMGYVISIGYLEPVGISDYIDNQIWGGRSMAYLFTVTMITDTAAYIFGVKFGKHQLAPTISPKKSVEGAIAGLVFGTLFGVISVFLFQMIKFTELANIWIKILVIGVVSLVSLILSGTVQLGDLVCSKLKRSYEIKDFGNIFPGHGGVLDRFDSFIFAGATFYVIVQFMQLVILGA